VAARAKVLSVASRLLGLRGSNSARDIGVSVLIVLCVVR
jgi:hypothetical protein